MPRRTASISRTMVGHLNRLALAAAICLTVAIPASYAGFNIEVTGKALDLETVQTIQALEQIVRDRPELWDYEILRLQELVDQPADHGLPDERVVTNRQGQVLARTTLQAEHPVLHRRLPIHDSGRVVGFLETSRTIRPILINTAFIALISALAAWGLFIIFRILPIRTLGRAIADLADERRRLAATLRAIPDGIIAADGNDRVIFLNPVAEAFLGCSTEAAIGRPLAEIYPVRRPATSDAISGQDRVEFRLGKEPPRILEERYSPLPSEASGKAGRVIVFRDITTQLKADAELLRVRQVESLGVLAGGIAHDFNNYLSAILGNISLACQDLPEGGRAFQRLAEAMKATDRARSLSLKLLTFAKGGDPARRVVALAPLVQEAAAFATHGTPVRFNCILQEELWNAEVDEGLMSQVIHNLVINAVQAMQGQGHIHIRVENLRVEEGEILYLRPGRYLRVGIQDSGPGIPEAILPRIFEPYFTTKDAGNGLGLASCFNIMKAHGGKIVAESEPGSGATFLVYVPATEKALEPKASAPIQEAPHGRGHILVMEDDVVLQEVAAEMLARIGFTAHTCADGDSAIQAYTQALKAGSPFDVVIMDLTIPGGMGGREASARILALDPGACLIVSSGYSVDPVMARPGDFGFRGVLPKPYGLRDLARILGEVVRSRPMPAKASMPPP